MPLKCLLGADKRHKSGAFSLLLTNKPCWIAKRPAYAAPSSCLDWSVGGKMQNVCSLRLCPVIPAVAVAGMPRTVPTCRLSNSIWELCRSEANMANILSPDQPKDGHSGH